MSTPQFSPAAISQETLKSFLHYCPDTGVFRWRKRTSNVKAGDIAGSSKNPRGIVRIMLKGQSPKRVLHKAHRLAWLYVYGYLPVSIDHRDGDPSNNRISNLRECTQSQNLMNQRKRRGSKNPYKGVFFDKRYGTWTARITINYKTTHLGTLQTAEEAAIVYDKAAKSMHGEFSKPNGVL